MIDSSPQNPPRLIELGADALDLTGTSQSVGYTASVVERSSQIECIVGVGAGVFQLKKAHSGAATTERGINTPGITGFQ